MVKTSKPLAAVAAVLLLSAGACGSPASGRPQAPARTGHPGARSRSAAIGPGDAAGRTGAIVVQDLSWAGTDDVWALASVPCGPDLCAEIARTTNGGRSWDWLPAPKAYLPGDNFPYPEPTVRYLRFVNPSTGYLFAGQYGNDVLVTRDGGLTWAGASWPPVGALEPSGGSVIRVAYDNGWLVQPMTGAGTWQTALTANPDVDQPFPQLVRPDTQVAYVAFYGNLAMGADSEHAAIYRSLNAGHSWVALGDPCGFSDGSQNDAYDLAAAAGGFVAVLCTSRYGSQNPHFMLTSSDDGSTWISHPLPSGLGAFGPMADDDGNFAAPSAGHLVLAAGNQLAISVDDGQAWHIAAQAPAEPPSAPGSTEFLGFESPAAGLWITYPRTIWTTQDGGLRWSPAQFGPTGT